MTSTPVSLKDDSLNGSWIDVHSASQINSPVDVEVIGHSFEPSSKANQADSVQNFGIISFKVERFLQEAQQGQQQQQQQQPPQQNHNQHRPLLRQFQQTPMPDDGSDIYISETEADELDTRQLIKSLRMFQQQSVASESNNNDPQMAKGRASSFQMLSKAGDLVDQLSDSLSLLSRASGFAGEAGPFDRASELPEFDWLWDWTAQPEYFTGQEWKLNTPKQDHLMRQRQMYYANLDHNTGKNFSGDVMSLLFLTNILSIIIGAGLTYSILMRKSTV